MRSKQHKLPAVASEAMAVDEDHLVLRATIWHAGPAFLAYWREARSMSTTGPRARTAYLRPGYGAAEATGGARATEREVSRPIEQEVSA